jgi:hypothetical protein
MVKYMNEGQVFMQKRNNILYNCIILIKRYSDKIQ